MASSEALHLVRYEHGVNGLEREREGERERKKEILTSSKAREREICYVMSVQLLQKLSIRATNGPEKLLRVVKQPVTKHLPVGGRRIGMTILSYHEQIFAIFILLFCSYGVVIDQFTKNVVDMYDVCSAISNNLIIYSIGIQ